MKGYKWKLAIAVAIALSLLAAMTDAATSSGTGADSHPVAPLAAAETPSASAPRGTDSDRSIANLYSKIPLTFERNDGQTDPQVKFLSRGPGYSLFLTERSAVLAIPARPTRKTARLWRI